MRVVDYILEKIGAVGIGFRVDLDACLLGVEMREVTVVNGEEEQPKTLLRFHFGLMSLAVIF